MLVNEQQHAYSANTSLSTESTVHAHTLVGKRILVVEDDEVLARFLERMLQAEGLEVQLAHSGAVALGLVNAETHLVVLDLNLPDVDGLAVLRQLRSQHRTLPVLVLTARARQESAVIALEHGADDCLTKPFSYLELVARLRAISRRHATEQKAVSQTRSGDLILDRAAYRATRNGKPIDLTRREFGLLEYLMRSPGDAVPRSVLHKELWGDDSRGGSNVVDVYMKYVRDKIDLPGLPKLIRTVRGIGYAICEA